MTLTDMLTGRFGEICLIRIGEAIHLKNREDIDILVADADEFLHTNLQQILAAVVFSGWIRHFV